MEKKEYNDMKEAIDEIIVNDDRMCKICNQPGSLEGKIRVTKNKRE